MFDTVASVADDLVLIRSAWSLHNRKMGSDLAKVNAYTLVVETYLFVMVLSLMVMPETVTSELMEPYSLGGQHS